MSFLRSLFYGSYAGVFINTFTGLYLFFVAPRLLPWMGSGIFDPGVSFLRGTIVLIALTLEYLAVDIQLRHLKNNPGITLIHFWLGHLLVTSILVMYASLAFGFQLDSGCFLLLMVLNIFKEVHLLTKEVNSLQPSSEWLLLSHGFLFLFFLVGETLLWTTTVLSTSGRTLGDIVALSFLFIVFTIPLRYGFLIEELGFFKIWVQWRWWILSMVMLVAWNALSLIF